MKNNPFGNIVDIIREDNKRQIPVVYRIGTVISQSPLVVNVSGTEQTSLLKNAEIKCFERGDSLLLIPIENEQKYIIACKVVKV